MGKPLSAWVQKLHVMSLASQVITPLAKCSNLLLQGVDSWCGVQVLHWNQRVLLKRYLQPNFPDSIYKYNLDNSDTFMKHLYPQGIRIIGSWLGHVDPPISQSIAFAVVDTQRYAAHTGDACPLQFGNSVVGNLHGTFSACTATCIAHSCHASKFAGHTCTLVSGSFHAAIKLLFLLLTCHRPGWLPVRPLQVLLCWGILLRAACCCCILCLHTPYATPLLDAGVLCLTPKR